MPTFKNIATAKSGKCSLLYTSVADPGCLSRIPDPDFYLSRIPDPKTATKERGEKELDVKPFYVATKFNKIVNYFSFEVLKKKSWANFQRIIELFTQKIVKKLFKIWSWDPGSRGQKGTGSRIPDPDPRHCFIREQTRKPSNNFTFFHFIKEVRV